MGFITGPKLTAEVSNAGGLGIMSAGLGPPDFLRKEIRKVRSLTKKSFGVNFVIAFPQEENIKICLEERVPVLSFFWGDPKPYVQPAHELGLKVIDQVGSVKAAQRSVKHRVDIIIAQGFEAGGHIAGKVTTLALVPRVVDAIAPTPVVAAGGITDARGIVAALALGASGVSLGTLFVASRESLAHPIYKKRLLRATEEDTMYTTLFGNGWPNAPHRTLRTSFVQDWIEKEEIRNKTSEKEPIIGKMVVGGKEQTLRRFASFPPNNRATGDIDSMMLLAGQGVGLVEKIKPASTLVKELTSEASKIINEKLRRCVT
jgi:NAD(P)H-dependent flavin oxidoreductase YrpB (nitropropane dioxygenase family)